MKRKGFDYEKFHSQANWLDLMRPAPDENTSRKGFGCEKSHSQANQVVLKSPAREDTPMFQDRPQHIVAAEALIVNDQHWVRLDGVASL